MEGEITKDALAERLIAEGGYDRDDVSRRSAFNVADKALRFEGDLREALEAWWRREPIGPVEPYAGLSLDDLINRVGFECIVPALDCMAYLRRHTPEDARRIMSQTLDIPFNDSDLDL